MARKVDNNNLPPYTAKTTVEAGADIQHVIAYSALVPKEFTRFDLGYTGNYVTSIVYKQGTTTVATITISYNGDKITSVSRS